MMKAVRELLGREPFVRFQIVMNSGDRITVEDPMLFVIGQDEWTYFPPKSNAATHIRPNQISFVRVDDLLEPASRTDGN
jgi:hypothetical protein